MPEAGERAARLPLPSAVEEGGSQAQQVPLKMLERGISLLIEGETGSGKEHLVRTLHASSSRRERPLVCVNCGALPAELVEAELFGYVGGGPSAVPAARAARAICAPPTAAS